MLMLIDLVLLVLIDLVTLMGILFKHRGRDPTAERRFLSSLVSGITSVSLPSPESQISTGLQCSMAYHRLPYETLGCTERSHFSASQQPPWRSAAMQIDVSTKTMICCIIRQALLRSSDSVGPGFRSCDLYSCR